MKRRAGARAIWAKVAAGRLDEPAVRAWLAATARRLLEADEIKGAARRDAIVQAVDLSGRKINTDEIRDAIRVAAKWPQEFDQLMYGRTFAKDPERRQALREVVNDLLGAPERDLDDRNVRAKLDTRISRALKEEK